MDKGSGSGWPKKTGSDRIRIRIRNTVKKARFRQESIVIGLYRKKRHIYSPMDFNLDLTLTLAYNFKLTLTSTKVNQFIAKFVNNFIYKKNFWNIVYSDNMCNGRKMSSRGFFLLQYKISVHFYSVIIIYSLNQCYGSGPFFSDPDPDPT